MKYHNPFLFLATTVAVFWLASFSRADERADTRAMLAMAYANSQKADPPPKRDIKAAGDRDIANPIPDCHCGCMETGQCKCKNCAERTADPTWKADPEYKEFLEWKKSKKGGSTAPVAETDKPYAKAWMADGWQFDATGGHWFKPQPVTYSQPAYSSFGACADGSCGVGGCSTGSCGAQSFAPMQYSMPTQSFQGFQSSGRFFGGRFGGGGGCANGACGR